MGSGPGSGKRAGEESLYERAGASGLLASRGSKARHGRDADVQGLVEETLPGCVITRLSYCALSMLASVSVRRRRPQSVGKLKVGQVPHEVGHLFAAPLVHRL